MARGLHFAGLSSELRFLHLLRRGPRIDEVLGYTFLHQGHGLARHTLSIEGRTRLQRMADVIVNGDVLAE